MDGQEEEMSCASKKAEKDETEKDCNLIEIDEITIIEESRLISGELVCDSYLQDDLKDFISDEVVSDCCLERNDDGDHLISCQVGLTTDELTNTCNASLQSRYSDMANSVTSAEKRIHPSNELSSQPINKEKQTTQSFSGNSEVIYVSEKRLYFNTDQCKENSSTCIPVLGTTKSVHDSDINRSNSVNGKGSEGSSYGFSINYSQCANNQRNVHHVNLEKEAALCGNDVSSVNSKESLHNTDSKEISPKYISSDQNGTYGIGTCKESPHCGSFKENIAHCVNSEKENNTQVTTSEKNNLQYIDSAENTVQDTVLLGNNVKHNNSEGSNAQCSNSEEGNVQCTNSKEDNKYCANSEETNVHCSNSKEDNIQGTIFEANNAYCAISQERNAHCANSEKSSVLLTSSEETNAQCSISEEIKLQCTTHSEKTNLQCANFEKHKRCTSFVETNVDTHCTDSTEVKTHCTNSKITNMQYSDFKEGNVQCTISEKNKAQCTISKETSSQCTNSEETNAHCTNSKETDSQCSNSEKANAQCTNSEETNAQCGRSEEIHYSVCKKGKPEIRKASLVSSDSTNLKNSEITESSHTGKGEENVLQADKKNEFHEQCHEETVKKKNVEVITKDSKRLKTTNKEMKDMKMVNKNLLKHILSEGGHALKKLVVCVSKVKDCDIHTDSPKESNAINEVSGGQSFDKEENIKNIEVDSHPSDSLSESPVTKMGLDLSDRGSETGKLTAVSGLSGPYVRQLTCESNVPAQGVNSSKRNSEDHCENANGLGNRGSCSSKSYFHVSSDVDTVKEKYLSESNEKMGDGRKKELEIIERKEVESKQRAKRGRPRGREKTLTLPLKGTEIPQAIKRKRGRPRKYFPTNENNIVGYPENEKEVRLSFEERLSETTKASGCTTQQSNFSPESKDSEQENLPDTVNYHDNTGTPNKVENDSDKNVTATSSSSEENKETCKVRSCLENRDRCVNIARLTSKKKIKVIPKLSSKRNIKCNFSSIVATQLKDKNSIEKTSTFCAQNINNLTQINNKLQEKKPVDDLYQTLLRASPLMSPKRGRGRPPKNRNKSNERNFISVADSKTRLLNAENEKPGRENILQNDDNNVSLLEREDCNGSEEEVQKFSGKAVKQTVSKQDCADADNKASEARKHASGPRVKETRIKMNSNLQLRLQSARRRYPSKLSLRMKQEVQEQCCGHWFPNTKRFVRHLIENSKSDVDSLHTAKLIDLGMNKCTLCTEVIWLNTINMKKHLRTLHDVAKLPTPNLPSSTVASLPVSSSSSGNSIDNSSTPVVPADPVPDKLSQNKKIKIGPKSKRRRPLFKEYKEKPCPMSKKKKIMSYQKSTRILCDLSQDPSSSLSSLAVYSIEDLPRCFKPLITVSRCKHKIRKKRAKMRLRRTSSLSENESLLSIKNKLKKFEDLEEISSGNIPQADEKDKLTCKVDAVDTKLKDSAFRSNPTEKEKAKLKKMDTAKLKKGPKVHQKTPYNKPVNLRSKKQPHSEPLSTKSLNKEQKKENAPKVTSEKVEKRQDENAKTRRSSMESIPVKKSCKKRRSRYSLDPDFMTATVLGRIRIRGRKRGRPRKRKGDFPSSETSDVSSDSDTSSSDFEKEFLDDEWKENEENIPTVELDLFTLSSFNEDVSVLLIDPKNPDFKVYASMDAIFVGDSALGDVTNQLGYISDSNNVVYVNPSHFLFPKIGNSEKEAPVLKSKMSLRGLCRRLKEKEDSSTDTGSRKTVKIVKKGTLFSIPQNNGYESIPVIPTSVQVNNKKNSFTEGAIPPKEIADRNKVSKDNSKSFKSEIKVSKEVCLRLIDTTGDLKDPETSPPEAVKTSRTPTKEKGSEKTPEKETVTKEASQLERDDQETATSEDKPSDHESKPKSVKVSSGLLKREKSKLAEQTLNNKVIIIKTSVKKDASSEDPTKTAPDVKTESFSDEKMNTMAAPPQVISLEEAAAVSAPAFLSEKAKKEKVIKTLTVNSVKNATRDLEKNVTYRVLADSKNPIIPGNIDCSNLDTIDIIDYDSAEASEDVNPCNSGDSNEMSKRESHPDETCSNGGKSQVETPILAEPKSLSPVKISTDSRVVVASAEILPFGTLEGGVCLEEVLPEVDSTSVEYMDKILPASSDSGPEKSCVKSRSLSSVVTLSSSVTESASERSFELENDSLNSLSDLEVSSYKGSERVIEPYSNGDINDIVQGNSLWSTPLLPSSESTGKIAATASGSPPLCFMPAPKSKKQKPSPKTVKRNLNKGKLRQSSLSRVPKKFPASLGSKLQKQIKESSSRSPLSRFSTVLSTKRKRRRGARKLVTKASKRVARKQLLAKQRPASPTLVHFLEDNKIPKNLEEGFSFEKSLSREKQECFKQSESEKDPSHASFSATQPPLDENLLRKKHHKPKKRKKMREAAMLDRSQYFPGFSSKDVSIEGPISHVASDLKMRILLKDLSLNDAAAGMSSVKKDGSRKRKKKKKHSKKKRREREELESLASPHKKKKNASRTAVSPTRKREPDETEGRSVDILASSFLAEELEDELDEEIKIVDDDDENDRHDQKRGEDGKGARYSKTEKEAKLDKEGSHESSRYENEQTVGKKEAPVKKLVLKHFDSLSMASVVKKNQGHDSTSFYEASGDENTDSDDETVDSRMDLTTMKIRVREDVPADKNSFIDPSDKEPLSRDSVRVFALTGKKSTDSLSPPTHTGNDSNIETQDWKAESKESKPVIQEAGLVSLPSRLADVNSPAKDGHDRLWHSRGAKLKAQIMITDHQKGIVNSSVGEKINSPSFKAKISGLATPKFRKKKDKIYTKDIRSYFSSPPNQPKKEDSPVLSPLLSSPLGSPPLKTPSQDRGRPLKHLRSRSLLEKSPLPRSFLPLLGTNQRDVSCASRTAPTTTPISATYSTPSPQGRGRKRERKPLNANMDIRHFLETTSSRSPKIGGGSAQRAEPLPQSHYPPPEKKPRLDLVKMGLPEESADDKFSFEGFERELRRDVLHYQILQDYVDVLLTNTLFDTDQFPVPIDQLCDWNDELLTRIMFEKG